jgi:transposase, IS5 family
MDGARDEEPPMRPKEPTGGEDLDLFRARLENIVDQRHALVRLAALIEWDRFDEAFGALYSDGVGRPGLPTRLMVGLHRLKHSARAISTARMCRCSAARRTSSTSCRSTARR